MSLNLADTRLSLEAYRIQVIEKLKAVKNPGRAHALIDEVDSALKATDLSTTAQRAFWEALHTDLDVIAEEWSEILGKEAAVALATILATAKAHVRQNLAQVSK